MIEENFLIDGIWIIRNHAGVCLFESIFTDFKKRGVSRDLITGLLTAIVSFSEEAFEDKLEYIKFKEHKIVLKFTKELMFIVAISEETDKVEKRILDKIDVITEKFYERFGEILPQERFDGGVSVFESFTEDLETMVRRKPLTIKLINEKKIQRKREKKLERRKRREREMQRASYSR